MLGQGHSVKSSLFYLRTIKIHKLTQINVNKILTDFQLKFACLQ